MHQRIFPADHMHPHSDARGRPPDEDVDGQQRSAGEDMAIVDSGASVYHNMA